MEKRAIKSNYNNNNSNMEVITLAIIIALIGFIAVTIADAKSISTAESLTQYTNGDYGTSAYSKSSAESDTSSYATTYGVSRSDYSYGSAYGSGNIVNTQSESSIKYPSNVYSTGGGYAQGDYASTGSSGYASNENNYNFAKTNTNSYSQSTQNTIGNTWSRSWR